MKKRLLSLMLLFSLSQTYGECVNSKMTRPIIVDTFCTLTTCCADLKSSLTNLNVNVNVTVTAVGPCEFTPITSAQVISSPGTFCLANDIIGTITIDADNVVLDLNGKEISGDLNGISITNHQCIIVKNGFIKDTIDEGVFISLSNEVLLQELVIVQCGRTTAPFGIRFDNSRNCIVQECMVTDGFAGIALQSTTNSVVQDCQVLTCTQNTASADAFLSSGTSNQFDNCAVIDFQSTTGAATGFNITENNTILTHCSARVFNSGSITNRGFNIQADCCVLDECIASDFSLIIAASDATHFNIAGSRNCIRNCVAQCGNSDFGSNGFLIGGSDNIIEGCKAIDLAANVGPTAGYQITGDRNIIKESIALRIAGIPGPATGFIAGAGVADLLITECEASSCDSVGIDISLAAGSSSVVNCVASFNTVANFALGATPPSGAPTAPGGAISTGVNIAIPTPP